MKKSLLFISILMLLMTGCASSNKSCNCAYTPIPIDGNTNSDGPQEVTLSAENFSKYVAVNTVSSYASAYDAVTYFSYFIGADNCRFIDCSVSYKYVYGGSSFGYGTIPLTISGDGQANPFHTRENNRDTYYTISITSASGTIYIY